MIKPTYKLRKLSKGLMSITLAGAFMTAPLTPVVTTAFATEVTAPTFPTDVTDANAIAQDYMTNYVNAFLNGGATAANTYSSQWTNWARTFESGTPEDRVTMNATNSAAMMLGKIYHVYYNTGYVSLETLDPFTRSLYDKIVASNRVWKTDDFKTTTEEVTVTEVEKQPDAIVEGVDVTVTKPAGSLVFDDNGNFLGWGTPESYIVMTWDEFLAWEKTWSADTTATNTSENTDTSSSDATAGEGSTTTEGTSSTPNQAAGSEVVTKTSDNPPTVELPVAPIGKSSDQPPVVDLPVYDLAQASHTADMTGTATGSSQVGTSEVVTKTSDTPPTVELPVAPIGKSSDQPPVVDLPVYNLEQVSHTADMIGTDTGSSQVGTSEVVTKTSDTPPTVELPVAPVGKSSDQPPVVDLPVYDLDQDQVTPVHEQGATAQVEVSKPVPNKDKVAPSAPVYQTGNTLPKTGDATSYLSLLGGGLLALATGLNKRRRHN